ncbi:MAG: PAS domain S-box protein [Pyrinomonadaceae bacterium]
MPIEDALRQGEEETQRRLRESEETYRILAEAASDAIIRIDEHSIIQFVNSSATRVFGYSNEEMTGQSLTLLMPESLRSKHREGLARYLQTGKRKLNWQSIEVPAQHKSGRLFPVEISFGEYKNDDKRLFIGVARDITERKQIEDALRQSKEFDDAVMASMGEGLYTVDTSGRLVSMNQAAEDLLGWTAKELRGRKMHDVTHLQDKKKAIPSREKFPVLKVVQNGVPIKGHKDVFVRKDGSSFDVNCSATPLLRDSTITGVVVVFEDITERKRAEGILERYRLMSERSSDIIWFSTPDGTFVEVNEAAVKTYGYTRDEFLKLNLRDIRHPSTDLVLSDQLKAANARGISFETTHIRKDGTSFPVEVNANGGDFGGERLVMAIVRDVTERKRNEDALRESEERRKLAQEAGNVGIWDWNILTDKTYWSETMWDFYGEQPTDLNPDETYWKDHIHFNDRDRVLTHIRDVVASDALEYHDEFRILTKDGSVRWLEALAKISRDDDGRAIRMYGVNLDITERKAAEEVRRISEHQLRLITDTVPALISYVDREKRFRFVNQRYTDWFGGQKQDFVGKKVEEVTGTATYAAIEPKIDEALSGKEVTSETMLSFAKAGERYVRLSYVPDIGLDGQVNGFFALISDLTDLKLSQELLKSSEDRIKLMVESLADYAIFGMDIEGRVESWNNGAEMIFGYSADEITGQSFDILFTPEDVKRSIPFKEMKTARQKGKASDERWHVRKDGTRFFASGVTMPLYVGSALAGYAKIASDLTERKRHAEELQRAHDELEIRVQARTKELAESNIALVQEMEEREIAERQRIDLLRRLVSSQEFERRRLARDLHDQLGQRLTALRLKIASLKVACEGHHDIGSRVQRLQEISERLDSEVSFLAWELRPSALDDLGLADSIGAFVHEWSKHHEILADFHSSGLLRDRINRDTETHLYRITQEALNNIAKHAEANHVTVLLEKRENAIILIIEDNGKGFDADHEIVPIESGKGLGLVGMRERASLIGGNVEIESAPGSGATIFVRVPNVL